LPDSSARRAASATTIFDMLIRIANFKGEIPRVHPRLLPDGFAQKAVNTRLTDGAIDPYRQSRAVHEFATPVETIYKDGPTWLGFAEDVDVVPGPVADNRLYFTGSGNPKVRAAGVTYELALTAPAAAPTLTPAGTLNPALAEAILYTYTFVTLLDEESAPAPLPATVQWSPGMTVTVSGFSAPASGRGVNRLRIYRSQTSTTGITDLYFVAELPVATTSYVHDLATAPLQEPIQSQDYDPAPAGLRGLTELPNGMMAAFDGKSLRFCEPFRPHAWPLKYELPVNYAIIGLAAFGSTLAVLTNGTPYIVTGSAPENMTMERLETGLPCVSARGVVDLGYAAFYPSHDGLVQITPSGTQIVSRGLFSEKEWKALSPETMFAARLDGKYVFAHLGRAIDTITGGTPSTDFSAFAVFETGGPSPQPRVTVYSGGDPGRELATRSIGLIDLTGEQPFYVDIISDLEKTPSSLYFQPTEGKLFILAGLQTVQEFDDASMPLLALTWKSRRFQMASVQTFGAIWVETEEGRSETNVLTTRVYADGILVAQTTDFNRPMRLPSVLAQRWEIEIEGTATISAVQMATTIEEMGQ
jgi:hypothetical protein